MTKTEQNTELAQQQRPQGAPGRRRGGRLLLGSVVLALAAVLAVAFWLSSRSQSDESGPDTFRVRRGKLTITVSEGGTIQAERIERIRSRVRQRTAIIYLVPEGTYITEEDVREGKLLVELDSSDLAERRTRQEVTVQGSAASLTKAREDYQIQLKQNESNIRAAELKLKFARMELEHYVGRELAEELSEETVFASLAERALGGQAHQTKIQLETDVTFAEEEEQRAEDQLDGTRRLAEKHYVTGNELAADELALKRRKAELEQSKLALDLFLRYQLPKEAEVRFAEWKEQGLALERVRAQANSEKAQALARLSSVETTYKLEETQLEKIRQQIEYSTIRATWPGLVVYASSSDFRRRVSNPIEEGATVQERQEIIHLPDLSNMVAELQIHESAVRQLSPGQRATITVDAIPDLRLEGTVKEVAILPNPQHWLQDVNVYSTTVTIEGNHPSLKPGMSCRAEISVATVLDTLYVPVQAVTARGDGKVCHVVTEGRREVRPVETGLSDDKFVEVKGGLREGELVLLNPPFLPTEHEEVRAVHEEGPPEGAPRERAEGGPAARELPEGGPTPHEQDEGRPDVREGEPRPPAPTGGRGEMMRKMRAAGITREDFERWRSGEFSAEDREKLQELGITQEQIQTWMSHSRPQRRGDEEPR